MRASTCKGGSIVLERRALRMKKDKISEVIGHIDDEYIEEAALFEADRRTVGQSYQEKHGLQTVDQSSPETQDRPVRHRARRLRWARMAAGFALFLAIGLTTYSFVSEAREYQQAVIFFEENGLSAEGLSRHEVKAVYRDITQKSFSYQKTAEVITGAIPGWEIRQNEPSPEELAALWDIRDSNLFAEKPSSSGVSYRITPQYVMDEDKGYEVLDQNTVECFRDGTLVWTAVFTDFYVEGCTYTPEGTAVWGRTETTSSMERSYIWIASVDDGGNIRWQHALIHGFADEYAASVLPNGDGTWAVISRGDLKYLCLTRLDRDGKELYFHKTEVGNLGIWQAARLGDGYIVQLGNQISNDHDHAHLYRMDSDGNITDSYTYEADDCEYYLTDMIEYNGQVYLSAYAVPLQEGKGNRHEIAHILDYIFS